MREGTEVMLTTVDNRILSFTNWEDNSTSPVRTVRMDGDKDLTAIFSAVDYIVGWDFYFDQPNSERAADYRDERQLGSAESAQSRGQDHDMAHTRRKQRCRKRTLGRTYMEGTG